MNPREIRKALDLLYQTETLNRSLAFIKITQDWCKYETRKTRDFGYWIAVANLVLQGSLTLLNIVLWDWAFFISFSFFGFALWSFRKSSQRRNFYKAWDRGMDFFLEHYETHPDQPL